MIRWAMVVELRVVNQPGTLARLARVFSERGINLGDILALVGSDRLVLPEGQVPRIAITFQCSERLRCYLRRRILRMPEVARALVLRLEEGDQRPIWEVAAEVESRGGED
jgi:acetolactate synthase small subunit